MKRWGLIVLGLVLCCLPHLHCGYTTRGGLIGGWRTIHVEGFENKIDFTNDTGRNVYLPLLEIKVRNAIINRFMFDGNLKIAAPERADLLLKGKLLKYERDVLRETDNDDAQEYRVRITVALELLDQKKNETVWQESSFAGEATYFVTGAQAKSEESAVEDAMTDLARRVVERTVENW